MEQEVEKRHLIDKTTAVLVEKVAGIEDKVGNLQNLEAKIRHLENFRFFLVGIAVVTSIIIPLFARNIIDSFFD